MDFGDRIKKLREEKGLSREEMSNQLNISYSALSKYETNKRFPDKNTLIELANFFDVSVDYIIGRTDVRKFEDFPEEIKGIANLFVGMSGSKQKAIEKLFKELLEK